MKLLAENMGNVSVLKERYNGIEHYIIEGVVMQSEIKNKNRRIYPYKVLSKAVKQYTEEFINNNRAMGTLDHDNNPGVKLCNVSHRIISMRNEGNDFIGKAMLINEGNGKIAKGLIDAGCTLGASSKGLGSVITESGVDVIQDDFVITSGFDLVSDPSAFSAFVHQVMEEADWYIGKDGSFEKKLKNEIKDIAYKNRNDIETAFAESVNTFLSKLSKRNMY